MFLSAMDLGWKRICHLVVLLIFLKHAVGNEGWTPQNVQPQHNLPVRKLLSLREVQSSVLEAPVGGSIPVEEVASNMFAGKSLNPSRSLFSLSSQSVNGGFSSSYEPMSHTQSGSDSISSLLPLQGSSSPNAQNVVSRSHGRQGSYSWSTLSSQDASGVQGVSAQPASTPVRGGSASGLFILSQSSPSLSTPDSLSKLSFSPLDVSALPTSDQSSSNVFTASSQSNSVLQLGGASSLLSTPSSSSTGSSGSSRRLFTSHQGSSGPQLAGGSSQLVSTSGLLTQSPSTGSQSTPGSLYTKLATSHFAPMQTGSTFTGGSSLQLQGTSSQYAPALDSKVPVYRKAAPSGSFSLSQPSQWQPSSRWSQGFQTSGTVASQSSSPSKGFKAPSRFSTLTSAASPSQTAFTQEGSGRYSGLSLQSQRTTSQYSPGSAGYSKLPASPQGVSQSTSGPSSYSQYTSSSQSRAGLYAPKQTGSTSTDGSSLQLQRPSLSLSQPSKWQTSRWSQGFQTSGTVASQSSSPSQGFKAPSRFSTPAGSPGQFASTQKGTGRYSGLSIQSQSTKSQYSPGHSAYAKLAASPLGVSQSTSGQSSYGQYASSSQSRAGTKLASTSHFAPMRTSSTFTGGSSAQLQGTSSQYAPASDSKVPVYRKAAPSGSLSLSQPSQWQPSSRWSQGFQTSGTVASQSSSPSKGLKAPSRFSTLTSAASPSQTASTQEGSGRYSGLSIQSQSTTSQYSPGHSAYAKLSASPLGVRQSTSGPISSGLYTSSSQSRAGLYAPKQTGSASTDGSSLQLQRPSLSLSQPSKWETSRWSQGFETPGTVALQSGSPPQGSKVPSRFSTLGSAASPGQFASTQEESGRYSGLSSLAQGTLSPYSPGSPAYAKQGSSLLDVSSQSTSDQSSSGLYASSSQSIAGTSHYVPVQTGSTFTGGSSFQSQVTSSQNALAPLGGKVPVYSEATPSGSSLSMSWPSQWASSVSRSQTLQTSSAVTSQSSSPSQGFKAPSRFSTPAGSPGQFASTQKGTGRYSVLSVQSPSTSSQYSPGHSAYPKLAASRLGVSQSTSGQSSYGQYASSSQSRAGTKLPSTSHFAPMQPGSTFTGGSSVQLQGTSSQYAPASDSKVPVYRKAAPSGSLSLSQPSQWQPSSRWSQGFQTSGTVASQSSSPSIGFKAPRRFSTLGSAASPGQFVSTQEESGRYSGLSSLAQGTLSQYSPGSPAYVKQGSSLLDVSSQSTSDQSSSGLYTSSSQSRAGLYAPKQTGSASTDCSSLQLQRPSLSLSQPSKWSQGFETPGTVALQSGSPPQGSKVPSRFSTLGSAASPGQFASTQEESDRYIGTLNLYSPGSPADVKQGSSLEVSSQSTSDQSSSGMYASSSQSMAGPSRYVPVQTGSTFTGGSSFQSQGTSNQYAPSVSSQYTQASPSGSSLTGLAASGKWQNSASTWSQGIQDSGAAVPQSSSSPQSSWTSSGSVFPPSMSPSVAQSSSSGSQRTSSFFGVGLRPSKLSAQAASGSAISSQISPLSASFQHPSDSMTSSLGSGFQGASQGTFSGQSSDSTSVISSSYGSTDGQGASGFSRSSQRSSAPGRYSSVKG